MIPGFITVRTASSRLPKKCLLPFGDGNVIEHIIRRTKHYGLRPIICTTVEADDDVLVDIAKCEGAECFRGPVKNKLKRWADCCAHFAVTGFHSVDADDPFFDGDLMKKSYAKLSQGWDMVSPTASSSAGGASVGYSLTADIVARASALMPDPEADTEMMWYLVDKVPGLRKTQMPEQDANPVVVRLTLDYEEDYWLMESVRRIVGNLAARREVDDLFRRNPDLYLINWFRNGEWAAAQQAKKF